MGNKASRDNQPRNENDIFISTEDEIPEDTETDQEKLSY
jgi:hypothetical protein